MLVVEFNNRQYEWHIGKPVKPLDYAGDIVVVFDPSKTNMAMIVGAPSGGIISNLEFSGNGRRKGPVMDTTLYCQEIRSFLKQYLAGCCIYLAATEATIEKKGTAYYRSNLVLTEIRANILNFFREEFHIECQEINNWSWKHYVLPDGYRSRSEKGSKRFLKDCYPQYGYHLYFEADMCDVCCMYLYVLGTMCASYTLLCNRSEPCTVSYGYAICPLSSEDSKLGRETVYNDRFSFLDNVSFYANRIMTYFHMEVPASAIPISDIYDHASGFELCNITDEKVRVVVSRCQS